MNAGSPGSRAVAAYELEDIFLVESRCEVNRDFNPTQVATEVGVQHRVTVDKSVLLQARSPVGGGEDIFVIRYLVAGELRSLMPDVPIDKVELSPSELMATIRLTFAADYRCSKEDFSDKDAIASFVRNVVFHVWPYWREAVSDFGARMRLPRTMVPMLKADASVAQRDSGSAAAIE